MAIQNNLKAIFYGKVGQLVGQRYKDKNIVRSYKKPTNPQTPLQQLNRQQFAQASKIASYAMSINFKAPCWEHPSVQEYALRLKTAKNRLKNYSSGLSVLPIYPDGYTPHTQINDITLDKNTEPSKWVFKSDQLARLTEARQIWFLIEYFNSSNEEYYENTIIFTSTPGQDIFLKIDQPTNPAHNKISIVGVSIDDKAHDNKMTFIHTKDFY